MAFDRFIKEGEAVTFKSAIRGAFHLFANDICKLRRILPAIGVYAVIMQSMFHTICPVRAFLRVNCPGCGLTRGCLCVLTGQWSRAFSFHPASFAWVVLIAWLIYRRYFRPHKKIKWELPVAAVGLLTILVWVQRAAEYFAA